LLGHQLAHRVRALQSIHPVGADLSRPQFPAQCSAGVEKRRLERRRGGDGQPDRGTRVGERGRTEVQRWQRRIEGPRPATLERRRQAPQEEGGSRQCQREIGPKRTQLHRS